MKKLLLLSFLFFCAFATTLQAKINSPYDENISNVLSAQFSSSDTIAIPWQESFEKDFKMPDVTTTSVAGDNYPNVNFSWSNNRPNAQARTGKYFAFFNAHNNTNDWLFTPGIFLRAGTTYYFSFWHLSMETGNCFGEIFAGAGSKAERNSMKQIGETLSYPANTNYRLYVSAFTPETDGEYYFGIYAKKTTLNNHPFVFDDLEVSTTYDCSLFTSALQKEKISDVTAGFSWNLAPLAHKYILEYKLKIDSIWTSVGIPVEKLNYQLTGLLPDSGYQVRLKTLCSLERDTVLSNVVDFKTYKSTIAPFPIDEKFDGTSGINWKFANDSTSKRYRQRNKWYIGGTQDSSLKQAAFISNTQGNINNYDINFYSTTYIYTNDFFLPKAEEYLFSFDWKANGEAADYLRAYICGGFEPNAGTIQGNFKYTGILFKDFQGSANWKTEQTIFGEEISETVQRIAFAWINDSLRGSQPPAAIDNIIFKALNCGTPKELTFTNYPNGNSLQLACKTFSGNNSFDIAYRVKGAADSTWLTQKGNLTENINKDSLVLKNLTPQTTYEIKVQKRCSTDTSFWSGTITARTSAPIVDIPFIDNFETFESANRNIQNGTQVNKWETGNAIFAGNSGKGMYISKDGGTTNAYDDKKASIVHFYYDLNFPQLKNFILSFDWKSGGSSNDYMQVSLVDIGVVPTEGAALPKETRLFEKNFYNHRTWMHEDLSFVKIPSETQKRLVFTWINSGISSTQPPVVIDNISLQAESCVTPNDIKMAGYGPASISLMYKKPEANTSYEVNYRKQGTDDWSSIDIQPSAMNGDILTIGQLAPNTEYEIKMRKICPSGSSAFSPILITRTTQNLASIPFVEDFRTNNWTLVNGTQNNHWKLDTTGNGLLFITDENNVENKYNTTTPSIVHCYRDILFPEAVEYELVFRWRGVGEKNIDKLSVLLENPDVQFQAGTTNLSSQNLGSKTYSGSSEWQLDTILIPGSQIKNTIKSLIFTWENNASGGEQTPVAIDYMSLKAGKCYTPTNLTFTGYTNDSNAMAFRFKREGDNNNFLLAYTDLKTEVTKYIAIDSLSPVINKFNCNRWYSIAVQNVCGIDSSLWSKPIQVLSSQIYGTLPFYEDFENEISTNQWIYPNFPENPINKWFIGTASYFLDGTGNHAAYIDTLDGSSNGYNSSKNCMAFMYKDILFPVTKNDMPLSFKWKNGGGYSANLRVIITDLNYKFPSKWTEKPTSWNTFSFASNELYTKNEDDNWHDTTFYLPTAKLSGQKKRLTIVWTGVINNPANPPASIDNISITAASCPTPQKLTYKSLSPTSVQLTWTCAKVDSNKFSITYKTSNETTTVFTTDTTKTLTLKHNTPYEITLINECGGSYNTPVKLKILTSQIPASPDFYNDFFETAQTNEWTTVTGSSENKWHLGGKNFSNETGGPQSAAYISNDNGVMNEYSPSQFADRSCIVHAYRDIKFDNATAKDYMLSFDWRFAGDGGNYTYMKVYLVDSNIYPKIDTLLNEKYNLKGSGNYLSHERYWKNELFSLTKIFSLDSLQGKTKRLVFSWRNAITLPSPPTAAAFSNLSLTALDCKVPTNLKIKSYLTNHNSVVVSWDSVLPQSLIRYRKVNTDGYKGKWDSITANNRASDTLKGLISNNVLYEVQILNNTCTKTSWSPSLEFRTLQNLAPADFVEDFETQADLDSWSIVNGDKVNNWVFGDIVPGKQLGTNHSAYISDDGGRSNTYTGTDVTHSLVHIYRDFEFNDGQKEFFISFDWKGMGQSGTANDFMQMHLVNTGTLPVAGTPLPDGTRPDPFAKKFRLSNVWKTESALIPATLDLKSRNRLVFSWKNNNTTDIQPAVAIDNIKINTFECYSPKNIRHLKPYSQDSIRLKWTSEETNCYYNVRYKNAGSNTWVETIEGDSTYLMESLDPSGKYEVQIQTHCDSNNKNSAWISYFVETAQKIDTIPFLEDFEDTTKAAQWSFVNGDQPNKWYIGILASNTGKSAFISDSNGFTYEYQITIDSANQNTHIYRDICFIPAVEYMISFDWKSTGDGSNDYMYLSLIDTNVTLLPGVPQTANRIKNTLSGNSNWKRDTVVISGYTVATVKRLAISWINNQTGGSKEPGAIDNILITPIPCKTPTNLALINYPDLHSAKLKWTATGDTFAVGYKKESETTWQYRDFDTIVSVLDRLDSNTIYDIKVQNKCPGSFTWTPTIQIRTPHTPIVAGYEEDFESGTTNWIIVDGNTENRWYVGDAGYKGSGNKSIYVSNDGGLNNHYTLKLTTIHLYKDIIFPETSASELFFDWKLKGTTNGIVSSLLVSLVSDTTSVKEGTLVSNVLLSSNYYLKNDKDIPAWKTASIIFPDSLNGTPLKGEKKRLVFTWNAANGAQDFNPPAAIDNIRFLEYKCGKADSLKSFNISSTQASLSWKAGDATNYTIKYQAIGTGEWVEVPEKPTSTEYTLQGLTPGSNYLIRIIPNCAMGVGRHVEDTFLTPYTIPFGEPFTNTFPENWAKGSGLINSSVTPIKLTTGGSFTNNCFANILGERQSMKISFNSSGGKDWLITPPINITTDQTLQLEFTLGLTKEDVNKNAGNFKPDIKTTSEDKIGVFISTSDSTWSFNDVLAMWDYKGKYSDMSQISYSREGSKYIIPLENYKGKNIRIGFYVESSVDKGRNDLFIDSVYIRPYKCIPVSNVRFSEIDFTTAEVRWNKENEEQYLWELRYGTGNNPSVMDSIKTMDDCYLHLQSLDTNHIYNVYVRALCSEKDKSDWTIANFATLSLCAKVVDANIVSTPSDLSAVITWQTDGTHKEWELRYDDTNKTFAEMTHVFITQPTYTITGLTEKTSYAYYLRAICLDNDTSNWTDRKTFTTIKTPCLPVSNITVNDIMTNTAKAAWQLSGTQTKWEVRYGSNGASVDAMMKVFTSEPTVTLSSLNSNSSYDLYVRGVCRVGDTSEWSSKKQFQTLECKEIDNLRATKSDNKDTIIVKWNPKAGHTNWNISITERGSTTAEPIVRRADNDSSYKTTYATLRLDKNKDHNISVKASCGSSETPWSDPFLLAGEVGINTMDKNQADITLSPNPAKDFTKLSISGVEGMVSVQIHSLKGELIMTENLNCTFEGTKEFTIKGLRQGAYTIRLVHEKWTTTEKLIMIP